MCQLTSLISLFILRTQSNQFSLFSSRFKRSSTSTAAAAFAIGKRKFKAKLKRVKVFGLIFTYQTSLLHIIATSASSNPRDEPPEIEAARKRKDSVISSPATMRVLNVLR